MTPSIWQLLIVLVIVLLLFGRGKIPQLMGDMAKGIKSFKKGMSDEEKNCLLYTSPSPRDRQKSRMPSSA